MPGEIPPPTRADIIAALSPIITEWYHRLPNSSDLFVFDPEDAEALASAVWDTLSRHARINQQ